MAMKVLYLTFFVSFMDAQLTPTEERFLEIPDENRTLSYVFELSEHPSLAGTPGVLLDALYIRDKFVQYGIPEVEIVEYQTMLSYPTAPSVLEVLSPNPYNAVLVEPVVPEDPTSGHPDIVQPFLGFAASGDITADLVYVNYARPEDFELLESLGYDLTGKLGICRFGLMHRGLKPFYAEQSGLAGLIIYSDPNDDGYGRGEVYPEGRWRPPFSVQRGAGRYVNLFVGDPLTPGKPAYPGLAPEDKKYTYETTTAVPRIPTLPIGYGDAQNILTQLDGINVNTSSVFTDWQGGLPFEYHVGGIGTVRTHLFTEMEFPIVSLYNVIGTIPGAEEPDRQVLLGGHHDAWTFGSSDPHSGTGPLIEVARSFGLMLQEGWRPRRTIKFCSWDGEEHGLQGSTEWVEDFVQELRDEAIIYHNIDGPAKGYYFSMGSPPSVYDVFTETTQQILKDTGRTVYDDWLDERDAVRGILGTGSDYTAFLTFAGVSVSNFGFSDGIVNPDGSISTLSSGNYHSAYDSNYWIQQFSIPENYRYTSQILGVNTLKFAEADILPFNFVTYADVLDGYVDNTEEFFEDNDIGLDTRPLRNAVLFLRTAAMQIQKDAAMIDSKLPRAEKLKKQRVINDRLKDAEQGFLTEDVKLYRREEGFFKHTIYAPSFTRGYNAVVFPGVTEASEDFNIEATQEQLDVLTFQITEVARILSGNKKPFV